MTQMNNMNMNGANQQNQNGLAIAGFVCSLVGLFLGFVAVLGIIFSAIGLSKSNNQGAPHRGMAIAGLVIGIVAGGVWLIILASIS